MKRIFFILFLLVVLLSACSSDPSVHAAFRKYSGKNGVTSLTLPGFAVRTASRFAKLDPAEKELLRNVELLKVLVIEDHAKYNQVDFYKEFTRMVGNGYLPLLEVKDDHESVNVMAKMINEEEISDLLIIVGGNDNAMIYIKGNFSLSEIAEESDLLKGKDWKSKINI